MDKKIQTSDLRKILAFRFLKENELEEMLPLLEIREVSSGQVIIEEFTEGQDVYFLLEGTVNVMVTSVNKSQAYIAVLGDGDSFSESGIFPKMPRSANIVAAEDCTVLLIHRKDLLQFIAKYPAGGTKILMMIIYSLLKKLRVVNRELAFERIEDSSQVDIDALVKDFMNDL